MSHLVDVHHHATTEALTGRQRRAGTDVPWANPDVLELQREDLIAEGAATGNLDAVSHGNAFGLFPALARRIRKGD